MKVALLQGTSDPLRLMYTQTRGTTTSKGFDAVWNEPEKFFPKTLRETLPEAHAEHKEAAKRTEMIRVVTQQALDANHWSVARGVKFTFAFECSRSTGRQMLRHIVDVNWEEMSQRYVKLLNREWLKKFSAWVYGIYDGDNSYGECMDCLLGATEIAQQVFELPASWESMEPELKGDWLWLREKEVEQYLQEIEAGISPEDARENLPNCTKTQMIATMGFEAIHNFIGKRLCTRAQEPIREIAKSMRKQLVAQHPWLGKYMAPHCMPQMICPEARPDGCPLLFENGGQVLRRSEAAEAIKLYKQSQRSVNQPTE